eukprot:12334031-Alexandrium_andersonii.AAC.1
MHDPEMRRVLSAHGAVQQEAAHALHGGMRLGLVGRYAFLLSLITVVGGPRCKVGTRACERGEVLAKVIIMVFNYLRAPLDHMLLPGLFPGLSPSSLTLLSVRGEAELLLGFPCAVILAALC